MKIQQIGLSLFISLTFIVFLSTCHKEKQSQEIFSIPFNTNMFSQPMNLYNGNRIEVDIWKDYIILKLTGIFNVSQKSDNNRNVKSKLSNNYEEVFIVNKKSGSVEKRFINKKIFITYNDEFFIIAIDNKIFVFYKQFDNPIWSKELFQESNYKWQFSRPLIINNIVAIYNTNNSMLFGFDINNGSMIWDKYVKASSVNFFSCGDTIVTSSYSNLLFIDAKNGKVKSKLNIPVGTIFYADRDIILYTYTHGSPSFLWAYDVNKKRVIWKNRSVHLSVGLSVGPPVRYKSNIYSIYIDNNASGKRYKNTLGSIDIRNGALLWSHKIKDKYLHYPLPGKIVNNEYYWPLLNSKKIFLIDKGYGKRKRTIYLNNTISSTFAYKKGIIYYVSKNTIYAEKVEL